MTNPETDIEHSSGAQPPDSNNPINMNPEFGFFNNAQNNFFHHSTINNVIGDQHLHNIYQLSGDKVKEIRAWINPPDPSANYVTACDKMTEGTGLWLIQDERFKKWMKNGNLLWLQGKGLADFMNKNYFI
ncbi:hypothetical protein K435DRAFT_841841 [Dendrothele bispora CBS 962.96]|uniref:Uncharacterized protein n=1 Tax=Dendrothele bispora (strain CBS 962.96) TaxID=1314807 RepID=A0A4S8LJT7_DENBC|nr:hypothetical protein K435DRAFT_841841 [Dendrothele bispora CBS 962.96]